jgi:hypothetical protein
VGADRRRADGDEYAGDDEESLRRPGSIDTEEIDTRRRHGRER